jgi:hypothetical protein
MGTMAWHTLEKHQPDTNMSSLPAALTEAIPIADDVKLDAARIAGVLQVWMSLGTDFLAIGNFGPDLHPLPQHPFVGGG